MGRRIADDTAVYQTPQSKLRFVPNIWDLASLVIIFSLFGVLAWGASQMSLPYRLGEPLPISLSPWALPAYAVNTVLRMFIAMGFSLIFTLTVAPIAAKNPQAEKFIIPLIDILQSVPILGFLSITIVWFIALFPHSLLGPECAAIFVIFTSQVWNMVLSFYQSLKTIPQDMKDTAAMLHLSGWQKYWKIEVPQAIPSLLWNAMISMSAGWFFVVASEAISVSNQQILLPGIGSYISVAVINANLRAIFYAILTMLIVILLYDQLLFRPLLAWAEKFKPEFSEESLSTQSWFYNLLAKTRWWKLLKIHLEKWSDSFLTHLPLLGRKSRLGKVNKAYPFQMNARHESGTFKNFQFFSRFHPFRFPKISNRTLNIGIGCWNLILLLSTLIAALILTQFILTTVTWHEIQTVFYLGFITGIKVAILTILVSCLWIPVGVWIGLNPRFIPYCQPLIQFIAAFPINLIYPIAVTIIVFYNLNLEIWTAPLMILGTQWYILFNVIAGASAIPKELRLVTQNFGVKRWLLWKRLILPAIFPYYITGAMTAAAGSWNASIVAEVLSWGNHKLIATGLGSYITAYTTSGDFQRIALGIAVMCCYVLLINRLVWNKLYQKASTRFVLE